MVKSIAVGGSFLGIFAWPTLPATLALTGGALTLSGYHHHKSGENKKLIENTMSLLQAAK